MFLFALKMCVADLKRIFHRFWWVALFFMTLIIIGPLCDAEMYAFTYIIVMVISLLIPRISRIHFVLPLDEGQMKKIFVYRLLIVCGAMMLIAAVFIGIRILNHKPWEVKGLFWISGYISWFLMGSQIGIMRLGNEKENKMGVGSVIAIVVGVIGWFIGLIAVDYLPTEWMLCFCLIFLIMAIAYAVVYMKKTKIEDYSYVPFGLWDNGKIERN